MNSTTMTGAFLMTFALLSYGVGSILLVRFKMVSRGVLGFLLAGFLLDVVAIVCMNFGAQKTSLTLHEFLGYFSLLVMLIDLILVWNAYRKNGTDTMINKFLYNYAKFAFGWWLIAYLAGSLLIILK